MIRSWFGGKSDNDTPSDDFTNALYAYRSHVYKLEIDVVEKYRNNDISEVVLDTILQAISDTQNDLADINELTTVELYALSKRYETTHMPKVLEISMTAHSVLLKAKAIIDISLYKKIGSADDNNTNTNVVGGIWNMRK